MSRLGLSLTKRTIIDFLNAQKPGFNNALVMIMISLPSIYYVRMLTSNPSLILTVISIICIAVVSMLVILIPHLLDRDVLYWVKTPFDVFRRYFVKQAD
jgi:hypothetical protein